MHEPLPFEKMNVIKIICTIIICLLTCYAQAQTNKKSRTKSTFEVENLGNTINTAYDELGPIISPDGKTLFFVIDSHPENSYGENDTQDIWFSQLDDQGNWTKPKRMPEPFNVEQYNSIESVTPDGNTVIIRGAFKKGIYKGVGFSSSYKMKEGWSLPEQLEIEEFKKMNKGVYTNAFLSNDARTLLLAFSETKKSEDNDLYVSFLQADQTWSKPLSLGQTINTPGSDDTPFLASDGVTMYFSSDRPGGLGSHDIYMTKRLDETWQNWSVPVNLGPGINTNEWDTYYSIDAAGEYAYMVSDKNTTGGSDIVRIKLKEEYRPEPVVLVVGRVFNDKTKEPLGAMINYETLPEGKDVGIARSNPATGEYKIVLPYGKNYGFMARAAGFISVSDNIDLSLLTDSTLASHADTTLRNVAVFGDNRSAIPLTELTAVGNTQNDTAITTRIREADKNNGSAAAMMKDTTVTLGRIIERDLYLVPIEVGRVVRLNNVFFDFNKATLKPESFPELDRVVEFLNENPKVEIQLSSHTDALGSDEYNQKLSDERAGSVKKYFISRGISVEKVGVKSFGESQPIADNETEEGRQLNRRVEFTVLKK